MARSRQLQFFTGITSLRSLMPLPFERRARRLRRRAPADQQSAAGSIDGANPIRAAAACAHRLRHRRPAARCRSSSFI